MRTVRLDDDAKSTLAALRQRTGLSISEVLKRGLEAYAASIRNEIDETPYEVYRRLDLGAGGDAVAPAKHAKTTVTEALILAGVGPLVASFAPELFGVY